MPLPSSVHVAFLDAEPFEAIRTGRKRVEYRARVRPDRTIEKLRPGTPIIFRQRGLTRGPSPSGPALLTTCARLSKSTVADGLLYRIHLADVRECTCTGSIVQGWRTRDVNWLRGFDHLRGAEVYLLSSH
jgi:hypothetical protein